MAYDASKNQAFFERLRNWAREAQNLREEGLRLLNVKSQEANGDPAYDDTEIATTGEADTLASYITEFLQFNDGDGSGALAIASWGQLLPFIDTTPA